jgi:PAS domain S-box-containing protein
MRQALLTAPLEFNRGVLDAVPDAMVIIDGSGIIRFANRQVSELFGHPHEHLIGKAVESLMPERFRSWHGGEQKTYGSSARSPPLGTALELFGLRRDGTEFPVEISLSAIEGDATGGGLIAVAIRDAMERKRLEAELRVQLEDMRRLHEMNTRLIGALELPKMLEEILDATISLQDADLGNVQLYDAATNSLSIVAQHGFSDAFLTRFRVADSRDDTACGRALRGRSRVVIEDVEKDDAYEPHRAIAAREGYRAVQSTPILARNGTLKGMLSTHFRQPHIPSERTLQLTDLYMRLAADLIARAQDEDAIRAARDAADRANLAKGRFLATASHDLRQPVQTLALLNGTLRRCVNGAEAVEAVAQQERAIDAMSRLLSGLLDISKLESGAIKPDPSDFAVKVMFEELRDEFAGIASCKGLGFRVMPCKEEDSVRSDRSLVGQVLRNLVSNALKYTREGWIALRCLHQAPDLLRLEVLDTGIGIPADQLRYIYDEFYQVGGQQQVARNGYGLGLSIVQRIVTLLDVKLDVQSEVGRGSRFALILPASGVAARHPASHRRAQPVVHGSDTPAYILLVEDDDGVRNATRMLLKSEGYHVTATASLAQALEGVRRDPHVDLLVTDYHLGDGKLGTQVIAGVREALGPQLKVVLMTGDTSSAIGMLAADRLMRIASKPVNSEELLGLLRALLASG